nr:7TM diverse intracellular signaling domain-containing protein [Ramlibacter algicola]
MLEQHAQYWLEHDGKLDIQAVVAAGESLPWAPMATGQQYRIDAGALWIRFDAVVRDNESWYVVVQSSGIDRVQLFRQRPNGHWIVEEAGDTRPVSQWPVPGRVPTFDLPPGRGEVERFWLRIEHQRVDFAAPIRLTSQSRLFAARETEQFLFGAYFGISVLLALVAVFNAVGFRDRVFAIYAVYLVTFTLGQAAYMGVGAQHLWDPWLTFNAHSTFVLPALSVPAALWFVQRVTEPARFSRRLNQFVFLLIGVLLAVALLEVVLPSRGILELRLALTGLSLALVAVLIGFVWTKADDPDIRIIALGFVPVMVMALFPILRGINLIPNSIFTRYGLAMGAAVEMPILFYALSRRGSRRREAQLRASALPRTDALTGLADRRSLLQRLEATLTRARHQRHPCALVVAKLANYDFIASQHGRDTLDRALVVTASHMRRAATDVDLAARAGEREFALLIEGPTTADQASSRAQQIVASGLRSSRALPTDLTLRLLVVVAMLPDQQPDAESSLQWVLGALAAIRPDSRKQIRSLNF